MFHVVLCLSQIRCLGTSKSTSQGKIYLKTLFNRYSWLAFIRNVCLCVMLFSDVWQDVSLLEHNLQRFVLCDCFDLWRRVQSKQNEMNSTCFVHFMKWTSYWPRGPQSTSLYYGNTTGFWLSPLSRGRRYNCTSYRSMQCLNASLESNTWWFYFTLPLDTLSDIHWHLLLRFAKASKKFYRPWGLSGMRTGPALWPQRWVSA